MPKKAEIGEERERVHVLAALKDSDCMDWVAEKQKQEQVLCCAVLLVKYTLL